MDFDIDRELADIDVLLQRYKTIVRKDFEEDALKVWIVFWALAFLALSRKSPDLGPRLLLACYLPTALDIVLKETLLGQ